MSLVLLCSRCGGEMPLPSDDERRLLAASGGAVTLAHDTCPGAPTIAVERPDRYFEVRVRIVEVVEEADQRGELVPRPVELASFTGATRAADLDSAMRPLAEALGEKWLLAEKHAKIADDPDAR